MFDIEDYNYQLPERLIAQIPSAGRDESRLLVVDRAKQSLSDSRFFNLPRFLRAGDLVIANDTEVVPARLYGRKESGGQVELLVLDHPVSAEEDLFTRACLVKASKRPKEGSLFLFDCDVSGRVEKVLDSGLVRIRFEGDRSIDDLMEEKGSLPLPPYIRREGDSGLSRLDRERYQTIFSRSRGAVAAPTAGLHFTTDLLKELEKAKISIAFVTLHVGYGTFSPVRTKDIRKHPIGAEFFRITDETAEAIRATKKNGGRVIAVGTTVVRTLETATDRDGSVLSGEGMTDLLITPGFSFKAVDALITNFHLPKSSLLFLVSAFAGIELTKKAYKQAVERDYRFYSYGDAMLII
ncbi:MAG: tRNA preQ1(34) S-adenosylmethionine ribosyltransferase-isomerase QueA [Thermodesulfobacteriota bacterium]|nr:tRNA preQ1(34) S-adenosylmethionine ribosyltransferase-isomerase QueA [Thermodesulfobacteriota bacterium]